MKTPLTPLVGQPRPHRVPQKAGAGRLSDTGAQYLRQRHHPITVAVALLGDHDGGGEVLNRSGSGCADPGGNTPPRRYVIWKGFVGIVKDFEAYTVQNLSE